MTQFTEKNQQLNKPAPQQTPHSVPKSEVASLSAQSSKLNLSVKIPQKNAAGPKLDAVQMKANPAGGVEPGQMTDADIINTVTHLVKAATVHPLGSSSANRDLRNQKASLDSNKEARGKVADQSAKNQQIIEQDKIQQKNTIERNKAKEGPGQANREAKVDIKTDKVIKQTVKSDAVTESKSTELAQKEVQRFKEEHAKSQSAVNANVSALAARNTSTEGEKESLSKDLVRERASEKLPAAELKVEALRAELQSLQAKLTPESRQAENRIVEVQQQLIQAASVLAHSKSEVQAQEVEDDIYDSWVSSDDRRRVLRKKKKLAKQALTKEAKRALRKMTPLERRKLNLKRDKMKRMRKRGRRKSRTLVLR